MSSTPSVPMAMSSILQPLVIPSVCGTVNYHYVPLLNGTYAMFVVPNILPCPDPLSSPPAPSPVTPVLNKNAVRFQPAVSVTQLTDIDETEEITANEYCDDNSANTALQDRHADSYCSSATASDAQSVATDDTDVTDVTPDTEDVDPIEIDHDTLCTLAGENDVAVATRTPEPPPSHLKDCAFKPRFNNRSNGNIFISKDKVQELVRCCAETFHTDKRDDERLMFGYFKERVALFIIDREGVIENRVWDVCDARNGKRMPILILNIGLHFKSDRKDNVLHLICTLNDAEHIEKVRWKVIEFMNKKEIADTYGIARHELPAEFASQRSYDKFWRSLRHSGFQPKMNYVPRDMIQRTNFRKVAIKTTKRPKEEAPEQQLYQMSQKDLKFYLERDWQNGTPMIPKQVIKGKREWREWEKFVCIPMNGEPQWIGVSMRYYESNRRWKIECLDFDAGRVYYQYKLIGEQYIQPRHRIDYRTLTQLIDSRYVLDKDFF